MRSLMLKLVAVFLLADGCVPGSQYRAEQNRSRKLEAELQNTRVQAQEAEQRAAAYQEHAVSQSRGLSLWQTVALVLAIGACVALLAGITLGSVPREPPPKEGDVQDADYEIIE